MVSIGLGQGGPFALLIADHERDVRDEISSLLRNEGYETYLASDDDEAIEIVHHEHIDVVVIDFELPHAGGLDTFQTINITIGERLPCVFTSFEVSGRVQTAAMAADAYAVVPKPVDGPVMKRVVRRVLERAYPSRFGGGAGFPQ
jgi:CheY-like chemotaxis protein